MNVCMLHKTWCCVCPLSQLSPPMCMLVSKEWKRTTRLG
jgi:hypothetical protein